MARLASVIRFSVLIVAASVFPSMSPSKAGSVVDLPTSVGTLSVTQAASPSPVEILTLGGATLPISFDGRPPGSYSESILKFGLGSVPAGQQITSAIFTFSVASVQSVIDTPSLVVSGFGSGNPTVSLADFTLPMTSVGGTGTIGDGSPLPSTFSFNVTGLLNSLIAGGSTGVGFLLAEPGIAIVNVYGDNPTTVASFSPTLTITTSAVPEPASILILASGIISIAGIATSRRLRHPA